VNYFRQVAVVFGVAWNGRKYSIKSGVSPARVHPRGAGNREAASISSTPDRSDFRAIGRVHRAVGPPHRRPALRDRRRVEAIGIDRRSARQGTASSPSSTPKARWF
jgi:hypothetical protein